MSPRRGRAVARSVARARLDRPAACGERWQGPGGSLGLVLWHACRGHVKGTGECVCPCGAVREATAVPVEAAP